jgi:hypothetical protein
MLFIIQIPEDLSANIVPYLNTGHLVPHKQYQKATENKSGALLLFFLIS